MTCSALSIPHMLSLCRSSQRSHEAHAFQRAPEFWTLEAVPGNFFCRALPQDISKSSELVHLDFDSQMLAIAQAKYKALGLPVKTIHRDASKSVFPVGSLDCIISVNALYAMDDPVAILKRAFHWLRPGGTFFIVNLGRVQNTNDWTSSLSEATCVGSGSFELCGSC